MEFNDNSINNRQPFTAMENPFAPLQNEIRKMIVEVFDQKINELLTKLNTATSTPQILSIKDAAAYLKMSVHTIYQFTRNSRIPFSKPRGKLCFKAAELDQWLLEYKHKTRRELGLED